MTEMSRLLPCPFCGEQPEQSTTGEYFCAPHTELLNADAWNRRSALRSAEVADKTLGATPETDALMGKMLDASRALDGSLTRVSNLSILVEHARSLERRLSARSVSAGVSAGEPAGGAGMDAAPQAWGDDVALRGPDAPKNSGQAKHLIEYLLTLYKRFGNTAVTVDLQWGGTALQKQDEQKKRIAELQAELTALRATSSKDGAVEALREIAALKPKPFEFPADWHEQIASCSECQRYKGHPIQQGICDTHRKPLWARESHNDHEEKCIGYRAKDIADRALAAAGAGEGGKA